MPARSAVGQLPEEIRDEINRRLVENSFSGYAQLAGWLRELGYQISKSALHRLSLIHISEPTRPY